MNFQRYLLRSTISAIEADLTSFIDDRYCMLVQRLITSFKTGYAKLAAKPVRLVNIRDKVINVHFLRVSYRRWFDS